MESTALTKTVLLTGVLSLLALVFMFPLFSRRRKKPFDYIFYPVILLALASLILFAVNKMRMMSDDILAKNHAQKIEQLERAHTHIKMNQAVLKRLIENGETKEKLTYQLGPLEGFLNTQETEDLGHFKYWLFIIQVIIALIAIPVAVNFIVYGATSRHQTTKVYEVPTEIYSKLTKLQSSVTILAATNTVLIFVVVISMLS